MPQPIVWDFFSGVGGFSLGFQAAGFQVQVAVEIEPIHAIAHHVNFPHSQIVCKDIRTFHPEKPARDIDVIAIGSPCQAFSLEGLQDPNDPRAKLSFEATRLVNHLQPKYFVLENVPAIANQKHVHILNEVIEKLEVGGYEIVRPIKTLNAYDFGVAQSRRRLFLLGYRKDCKPITYPQPQTKKVNAEDVLIDLADIPIQIGKDNGIDIQILNNHTILSGAKTYNDFGKCIPPLPFKKVWGHLGSKHSQTICDRFAQTPQGTKEPISRFFKLAPDKPTNTQKAGTNSGKGNFTAARPIHYEQPRCITIREAARLHGYPDWFNFHRTISGGFRQIGNSVCPPVAKAIGREIYKALEVDQKKDDWLLSLSNQNAAQYFCVDPRISGKRIKKNA